VISDLTVLLIGIAVGLPLAAWPGAVLCRTIRSVPVHGAMAGFRAAGGQVLADTAMIVILGAISLHQAEFLGGLSTTLGVLAGIALVGLGFRLMDRRVAGSLARELAGGDAPERYGNPVIDRLAVTLANPVWHLFWWTAGLRLVMLSAERGVPGVFAFAVGFLLPGLLWPTYVAARLARSECETALRDRQYRILTSLGGLALVAVGFWLGSEALAGSGIRAALARGVAAVFGGGTQ